MNNRTNSQFARRVALAVGGLVALAPVARAASFTYTTGDLVLGLRQSGAPDLVIDIGQASIYDAVPAGTTVSVGSVATAINAVYSASALDNLSWSITGSERNSGAAYPFETVWATAPRAVTNIQATAWSRASVFSQGNAASQIAAIGNNAATYGSVHPAGALNSATLVSIPYTDQNSYTLRIEDPFNSSESDLNGTFQGNVENVTPFDFDSDEPLSVSDLYELLPGGGPGHWVGYFSFTPDGNVLFTAAVTTAPTPVITKVTRTGNVTSVSFSTGAGYNYSLVSTSLANIKTPKSTWTPVGSSVTGTGGVLTLQNTNSASGAIYAVVAH